MDNISLETSFYWLSDDFTVNRFFMELFKTSDISVVRYCQSLFAFELPSLTLARRFIKFCQFENMRVC